MERTLIAFTSDHGDYLGDHWLGEKDLFHDCSARVPMIVCDPVPRATPPGARRTIVSWSQSICCRPSSSSPAAKFEPNAWRGDPFWAPFGGRPSPNGVTAR